MGLRPPGVGAGVGGGGLFAEVLFFCLLINLCSISSSVMLVINFFAIPCTDM